jgi:hypothetical protein
LRCSRSYSANPKMLPNRRAVLGPHCGICVEACAHLVGHLYERIRAAATQLGFRLWLFGWAHLTRSPRGTQARIKCADWHRFPLAPLPSMQTHVDEQRLLPHQHRCKFRPARGNIGDHKRLHERPTRHRPGVRDEIGLREIGRRIAPVRKRPNRNRAADRLHRARPPTSKLYRSRCDCCARSKAAALIFGWDDAH